MKKLLLTLFLFIGGYFGIQAQTWIYTGPQSSNSVYLDMTTVPVGIGTAFPGAKLDIKANEGQMGFRVKQGNDTKFIVQRNGGVSVGAGYLPPENGMYVAGKVGIGTRNPLYELDVNGGIKAKEITVTLDNWADYVFEKDYNMLSLNEVEAFINENKHLPGVPSAQEVVENGVNLAEMNVILLQKIEEMTLQMIRMQKEIDDLKNDK